MTWKIIVKPSIAIIVLMVLVFIFSSCAASLGSIRERLSNWKGRTADELYLHWGLPETLQSFSNGKAVAIYSYSEGPLSDGQILKCQVTFAIKNNKIIELYFDGDLDLLNKFVKFIPIKNNNL